MTNQAQALNVNITSRFWTRYLILHGGKSLSLEIGQGFADCL